MMPNCDYQAITDKLSALTNSEWKLEERDIFSDVKLKRDMGGYSEVINIKYNDRSRKFSVKGSLADTGIDKLSNLKIIRKLEAKNPETGWYLPDPFDELPVQEVVKDIINDILPRYTVLAEKLFESQLSEEELQSLRLKKVQALADTFCEEIGIGKVIIDPVKFAWQNWDEDSNGSVTIEIRVNKLTAYKTLAMIFAILG